VPERDQLPFILQCKNKSDLIFSMAGEVFATPAAPREPAQEDQAKKKGGGLEIRPPRFTVCHPLG